MLRLSYENREIELLTTKNELYGKLQKIRNNLLTEQLNSPIHSQAFYIELNMLLIKLETELDTRIIPTLDNEWYYSLTIDNRNACINLRHLYSTESYEGFNESYSLISIPVKTYSSSEYAEVNGISEVTVRQWIRRGKLRSVYKIGSDWRIPVLTEKPTRGFKNITYYIRRNYINLSQFGCFAMTPNEVQILATDKAGEYNLVVDGAYQRCVLNDQDREKLEHQLIETPDITNSDNLLLGYPEIEEPDHRTIVIRTGAMKY